MPRLLRALGLLGLLLVAQDAAATKLRLVGDTWPPFTDINLVNGGLATDIVSTALTRAGYTTEFEQVPWARALLGIGEGRYDVLVDTWFNHERTLIGEFSNEYLVNRVRFLKRKDSPIVFDNLHALHAYPIAVVRGYAYSAAFDNDPDLQKIQVNTFSMALQMLDAGRVPLVVEDEYVARYNLSREKQQVRDSVEFLPKSLTENSLHILVSLKNPDHAKIVASFDREIAAMKADGSYDRLFREHGL
ncbi:MAG: solute-binding family 3 protein [Pseudomonas sp.]|jgi:polar amino acid transport system substrate-binding protein|uniref:substrate-binding periplasmic protein n=1 Tax=Pseudomonas sp. TaxID=306 RepID=UPI00263A0DD0|nr:transporter substrate-binding domain-containing protein [Pseudomonas sp.]MDB6051474.1 solute-binding family 3 protein [Pseudomonas sp.]